jgi:hypothetical protein
MQEQDMKMNGARNPFHFIDSAGRWAHRGEEIRTLAEEARDPRVGAMLFRLAADYDRLARHAEERSSGDQESN